MGYTHYFRQLNHCPRPEWEKICQSFREMQAAAVILNDPLQIQLEADDPSEPYVGMDAIHFNGIGNEGCETMVLDRLRASFSFCKTRGRPYDRVVVALLCLAAFHAPEVWLVSSDGDEEDWKEGLALARTVEPHCPMPTFKD